MSEKIILTLKQMMLSIKMMLDWAISKYKECIIKKTKVLMKKMKKLT